MHVNPVQASKVKSRMPIHQRSGEGRCASIQTEVFDAIRRGNGNGTHARLHAERGRSRLVVGGASEALSCEQRCWRWPVGKSERPVVVVMAGKAGPVREARVRVCAPGEGALLRDGLWREPTVNRRLAR